MVQAADVVRFVLGVRALTAPAGPGSAVTRVLGVRQVAQSLVVGSTRWHALSAGVDLLHAATMLPVLAAGSARARRFAVAQASTAVVLVALELVAQRAADRG